MVGSHAVADLEAASAPLAQANAHSISSAPVCSDSYPGMKPRKRLIGHSGLVLVFLLLRLRLIVLLRRLGRLGTGALIDHVDVG